jgi:hypothetical protein
VYPDGPAPYYSVYAPGRPGRELEQRDEIKLAASEVILALAAGSPIITRWDVIIVSGTCARSRTCSPAP